VSQPDFLVDTSVSVALTLGSHEGHDTTLEALQGSLLGLAGHAWFETYSVLTRLPPPARRGPAEVISIIEHNFPESRFLSEKAGRELGMSLAILSISGGAAYDALVGMAAAEHGIALASRDQRARDIYRLVGAETRMLA
jgi:predicted nucleic acid-binding protein